ncbi:tetratricopeptide repeat protein [Actinoplanes sp. NPDC051411]|uniref:tetratricopeptide repeat protein n=1 Tax=Actinoplanes sp. NPDC051411 TaxID=3155522 RepID=UPI00342109E7
MHRGRGDRPRAVECYRNALTLYRRLSDRFFEADTLAHLADAYADLDHVGAARASLRQALTVLGELHHPDAGRVAARLRQIEGQGVAG